MMEMEVSTPHLTTATPPSITISLHPLVILNVSEHWTRTRAQNDGAFQKVIGAIIGTHKSRHLEICNSFELCYTLVDGQIVVDKDYYRTKEEQFKQVFPTMDFLGWYTTGEPLPTLSDVHVHKQISEITESPVLIKLSPGKGAFSELPITLYESVIDIVDSQTQLLFVPVPYLLATEEAERIGVDHVARVCNGGEGEGSLVASHLSTQHSAIKMLHSRVKTILDYVKAVKEGHVPPNPEVLRAAKSLVHRLPLLSSAEGGISAEFWSHHLDVSLLTYLGLITKGCEETNTYIQRFNVVNEKGVGRRIGIGGAMRGLFY